MAARRYPLPKRFGAALSVDAYARLRALADRYCLGNNYCLTVLLERIDDIAEPGKLDAAFHEWRREHC